MLSFVKSKLNRVGLAEKKRPTRLRGRIKALCRAIHGVTESKEKGAVNKGGLDSDLSCRKSFHEVLNIF